MLENGLYLAFPTPGITYSLKMTSGFAVPQFAKRHRSIAAAKDMLNVYKLVSLRSDLASGTRPKDIIPGSTISYKQAIFETLLNMPIQSVAAVVWELENIDTASGDQCYRTYECFKSGWEVAVFALCLKQDEAFNRHTAETLISLRTSVYGALRFFYENRNIDAEILS